MRLNLLDPTVLDRPANADWFVTGRASQRRRFRTCLNLLRKVRSHYGAALDIGCARGDFSRSLARFCGRVIGLDASQGIVAAARTGAPADNLEFRCCRFPAPQMDSHSFDLICALEVLYYFEGRQTDGFLAEVQRLLASGGVFLISVNAYGDTMASAERIRRQVESRFQIVRWELIYRELYYRIELPLIGLLEDVHYLRLWQPFDVRESSPAVVTPLGRWVAARCPRALGRPVLNILERIARGVLASGLLFALVECCNRWVGPAHGRNQMVLVAISR